MIQLSHGRFLCFLIFLSIIYLETKSRGHCYIYGNVRIYFPFILAFFIFLTLVVTKNDKCDALLG